MSRPLCSSRGAASGFWVYLHIFAHFNGPREHQPENWPHAALPLVGCRGHGLTHIVPSLSGPARTPAAGRGPDPGLIRAVSRLETPGSGTSRSTCFTRSGLRNHPYPHPGRGSLEMDAVTCGDPLSIFQQHSKADFVTRVSRRGNRLRLGKTPSRVKGDEGADGRRAWVSRLFPFQGRPRPEHTLPEGAVKQLH